MRKQSRLLGVARSTAAYKPAAEAPEDIRIKRLLDETYRSIRASAAGGW